MQPAGSINIASLVELVLHTGIEIVSAMRRCGVYHARTLVHGDVLRKHAQNFSLRPGQEWMVEVQVFHPASRKSRDYFPVFKSALLCGYTGELFCNDINVVPGFYCRILFMVMKRRRHGGGQRPGSSGPDDGRN